MRSSGPASLGTLVLALAPLLAPLGTLTHCGSDSADGAGPGGAPTADPSASATSSATATDTSKPPPPPPLEGCAKAPPEAPFDVDPEGPDTQIHAYGVVAKDGVWIAYDRPKANGGFDVYVTKLGCDGKALVAPVRVSESEDNELDPAIVWDGEKLLVAWSADMSGKTPNLEIRLRTLSATGEPLGPVTSYAPQRKGAPLVGNVWMPALAKAPSGYALVGTWGHDDAPGFQAFAQALDPSGKPIGDGQDLDLAPAQSQDAPSVVYDPAGQRIVAYGSIANDSPNSQIPDILVATGDDATKSTLVAQGGRASASVGAGGVWVAYQNGFTKLGSGKLVARKGLLQPAIAAADVGAAFVAYTQAANKSALEAYRVGDDGAFVGAVGSGGLQVSAGAAAYPLHFEHVGGDVFFVAYQEGAGQQIRAKARFVTLAP